jgi:hypothetical protein
MPRRIAAQLATQITSLSHYAPEVNEIGDAVNGALADFARSNLLPLYPAGAASDSTEPKSSVMTCRPQPNALDTHWPKLTRSHRIALVSQMGTGGLFQGRGRKRKPGYCIQLPPPNVGTLPGHAFQQR